MGDDPISKAASWTWERINPSGLMPQAPEIPNIPGIVSAPTEDDAAIREAASKQRELEKKRKGRASTILTGGSGDDSTAPTTRKILLGE